MWFLVTHYVTFTYEKTQQVDKELSSAPRMETAAEMQDDKHIALHTEERLNMIGLKDVLKVQGLYCAITVRQSIHYRRYSLEYSHSLSSRER